MRVCSPPLPLRPLAGLKVKAVHFVEDPALIKGKAPSAVDINPDQPGEAYAIRKTDEYTTDATGAFKIYGVPSVDRGTNRPPWHIGFLVDWSAVDQATRTLVFNFEWAPGYDATVPGYDPGHP